MTQEQQDNHRINELAEKWQNGTITETEKLEFDQWFHSFDDSIVHPHATPALGDKLYAAIDKALQPAAAEHVNSTAKRVHLKRFVRWAAAAIVVFTASGIAIMLSRTGKQQPLVQHTTPAIQSHTETITNNGDTAKAVQLPDGSLVTVSGHSTLSWPAPFSDEARDLQLTGEALFKVAKDAKRPFTVYAHGIATTALGTVFTVNTLAPDEIRVALLEGKVVVRSTDSSTTKAIGKVFLQPGQEFLVHQSTGKYLVRNRTAKDEPLVKAGSNPTKQPVAGKVRLAFSNEPLTSVFEQLTKVYKTNIRFDAQEIAGLYFTGEVLNSDSLTTVLTVICNMNPLTFTQEKGFILIKKSN